MWKRTWSVPDQGSAERAKTGSRRRVTIARQHTSWRSRARSKSRVATEHGNAGAVLGTTKRDHVLPNMAADKLAMMRAAVGQDVLNEIVAKLITRNCFGVSIVYEPRAEVVTYCRSEACVGDQGEPHRHGRGTGLETHCRQSCDTSR